MHSSKDDFIEELIEYLPLLLRFLFHHETAAIHELPLTQLRALVVLHKHEKLSVTDIASHLEIPRQQLTKIIDCLEDKQFVSRKENEQNRRITHITLTESGIAYLLSLMEHKTLLLNQLLNKLSSAERETLQSAFSIIKHHLPK